MGNTGQVSKVLLIWYALHLTDAPLRYNAALAGTVLVQRSAMRCGVKARSD